MRIDAHHHFWQFSAAEFGWISEAMPAIRRDFLPTDLVPEIRAVGIDGVVSVQARQTLEETRWLLQLANQNDFIKGVVGWAPLADANVRTQLAELASEPKLRGIRHIVQDEPNDDFILGDDFNRGIAALKDVGLVYDILIYERQLPQAVEFVDRHPQQVFVLDHLAKPRAKENQLEPWRTNIRQIAERQNVYCKLSGLATEADWQAWTEPQLLPYLETVVEAFGPQRLMFGSDWPVCLLAVTYQNWHDLVARFCSRLSASEQTRIFGETAIEAYRLA
jgi:L-fucono-1,5-lactonase